MTPPKSTPHSYVISIFFAHFSKFTFIRPLICLYWAVTSDRTFAFLFVIYSSNTLKIDNQIKFRCEIDVHWSLLTFSWSSSSGFSLLFSWLLLGGSLGSWGSFSGWGGGGSSWLFFFFLLSGLSGLSVVISGTTSSLVELLVLSGLFLDFDLQVSANLVVEILSESIFQHLRCLGIDGNFGDLYFRLFGNPIQSSFSLFLLNFQRDTLDWAFLNSFD